MDEIKILSYIIGNYILKEHQLAFRHGEQEGQLITRPKPPESIFFTPLFHYSCSGYTHKINRPKTL